MASYLDILRPQVLTQVVKQVVSSADTILNFMGMQPGGPNEKYFGHGREGIFHVFDDSRKSAKGRAPGTPAARSAKQAMKQVPFVYPRMHDSSSLLAEFVHNLGRIDDPAQRDTAGRDMIMRQTNVMTQRAANWRTAMVVGMLRDSMYFYQSGDDWYPTYTSSGALFQVNHRVPAGNKTALNMTDRAGTSIFSANIIDASWDNPAANIPLHFAKINQGRAVQGTGPVKNVLCNSVLWNNMINNDYLCSQAGVANSPFEMYERQVGTRPDGSAMHEYVGSFKSLPGVKFHISDEGLELHNGTSEVFTKHFADTMAIFLGEPTSGEFTLYQGSEPIAEYDGGPETVRVGLSAWSKKTSNPTGTEIYVLDNCVPINHDPYGIQIGTVVF